MSNTLNVSKYILDDFRKSLNYYYAIISAIILVMVFSYIRFAKGTDANMSFSGFGFSAAIFLFISGLNIFKSNFKFMQANNVSRKRFYAATTVSILTVCAFMALIDIVLNNTLKFVMPYSGLVEEIYKTSNIIAGFIWTFAIFSVAASAGWLITMVYYKCNTMMKTIISISPVFIIILLVIINDYTNGLITNSIVKLINMIFGLSNLSPYFSAMNLLIITTGIIALCYPLIRRMPIKE